MDGQATQQLIQRDDATVKALADAGKSCREIAELTGVHKATIARQLKHLRPRKATQIYQSLRADILAEMQRKILSSCTPAEIKKMAIRDKFTAYGILYDKEQAERGVTTGKSAPMVVIAIQQPGGSQPAQIIEVGARQSVDNSPHKAVDNSTSE